MTLTSTVTAIVTIFMQFSNGNGGDVRVHSAPYLSYEACVRELPEKTEAAYANAKRALAKLYRDRYPEEQPPELILEYSECVTDDPSF